MDLITKSPGLQHIAEKIFFNLDTQSYLRTPKSSESLAHHLGKCKHVNENWKNIIENPLFLFKACVQKRLLSEKLIDIFQKVISKTTSPSNLSDKLVQLLDSILIDQKYRCKHPDETFLKNFHCEFCHSYNSPLFKTYLEAVKEGNGDVVQIFITLLENPNASNNTGYTQIHEAAERGYLNIIKILISSSEEDIENPNAPDTVGRTPIHKAAENGHLDVIEFLYPFLTKNHIQDINRWTPSHYAATNGHFEVVKFFMNSIKTPKYPDKDVRTPFELAKIYGHIDREMKDWPWIDLESTKNRKS